MTRRISQINQLQMQAARYRKQRRLKAATIIEAKLRPLIVAQLKRETRRVRA